MLDAAARVFRLTETEEPENFRGGDPVPVIAASAHRFDFLALETTTLTPTLQIRDSKVMGLSSLLGGRRKQRGLGLLDLKEIKKSKSKDLTGFSLDIINLIEFSLKKGLFLLSLVTSIRK